MMIKDVCVYDMQSYAEISVHVTKRKPALIEAVISIETLNLCCYLSEKAYFYVKKC